MKRFYVSGRAAILALVCVGLVGCGQEVLDFRNAELVNGKLYKRNATQPQSEACATILQIPRGADHGTI